jgi:hypothetical protein
LEPTDEHGDMAEIRVPLDEPAWSVKAIMQLGRAGLARRHVALRRFMIDQDAPSHTRIVVYAVDVESALKACEAHT